MASANETIVVITGANTGIGWETVKALLQSDRPYRVFLGSRSLEKGGQAAEALRKEVPGTTSTIEVLQVDITSDDSINQAFDKVQGVTDHIDVLVNNAGGAFDPAMLRGEITLRQAWMQAYDTNVAGAQVMTHTFMPLLIRSTDPRLIFLTSGLASLENSSKGLYHAVSDVPGWPKPKKPSSYAYRSSKTALNMMMLSWHWELKADGVKVWSVSPGFLATDLGGNKEGLKKLGAGHPSIGGQLMASVIEGKRDADAGKVVDGSGLQPF